MANDFTNDPSVIAYWRFEDDLTDSIGSNDLTGVASPTYNATYKFEGSKSVDLERSSSQYLYRADGDLSSDFPGKSGTSNTNLTICGWLRAESVSWQVMFGKWTTGSPSFLCHIAQQVYYFPCFQVQYGAGADDRVIYTNGYNDDLTRVQSGDDFFYALVVDSDRLKITLHYMAGGSPGRLQNIVRDLPAPMAVGTSDFYLGCFNNGATPTGFWDGTLDSVVVFNRALCAEEIYMIAENQLYEGTGTASSIVCPVFATELLYAPGIEGSSISSGEAFGNATVANKNQEVAPSSIVSSTAFGSPVVDRGRWTFPTNRIDINAAITFGAAWNSVDVSAYVPAGTRAVLLQVRDTNAAINSYYSHTRPTGSSDTLNSLQRHLSQKTLLVALDSSRTFEGYFDNANLDVAIIAYTSTNNIGTTLTEKSLSITVSWQITDCSDIIPTTATFAVGFTKNNSGSLNWSIGYRRSDDTTTTRSNNFIAKAGATGFFQVKDAKFYQVISYSSMDTYIYGYLDHDEAANFPIPVSLKGPLVEDSWNRNFDFSPWVPSNAIAVILAIGDSGLSAGWSNRGNAQHVDSTDDIYIATETGGGQTTGRVIVTAGLDDNLCADVYMGHGANYDILLLGYFIDPGLPKEVQFVEDTGITSSEAFGSATVTVSQDIVVDSGIASAEAFGTATLSFPGVECTGIESAEAFGTPNVGAQAITVSSITSAGAFGTASLTSNISVSSITSAEAFGTAQLNQNVTCSSIESVEAFGTAHVYNTVEVPSIASEEAFGSTVVWLQEQYVTPDGLTSAEAFGTAQLDQNITCSGIESSEAFGDHTARYLTRIRNLTGITSAEAFGTVVVIPGPVTIEHSALSSAEAFGTAHVKLNITEVGQIGSAEAFGTAELGWGIHPVAIGSTEAFGTPRLDLNIHSVGGITSEEAIGTAHVKHQIDDITGISTEEAFGTAHLKHQIYPVSIPTSEVFGDNAEIVTYRVGTDIFFKSSQSIKTCQAFGTAHVKLNIVADSPIVSSEAFGTPTLSYMLGKPYWGTVKVGKVTGTLNVTALSGGVLHCKTQEAQTISVRSVTGMKLKLEMDRIEGQA